jgi:hypothetical protein
MTPRLVTVTIDTEVDKDATWRISSPATFRAVTDAVPALLTPLFERYGVVPTYLLSAEVIEDDAASDVLADLGSRAELGTHLHPQFVEPMRTLDASTMAGRLADDIQAQCGREVEAAKLTSLTRLFRDRFGRAPTSFRAGRYGASRHTLELLAGLGYLVDSSVTPGLLWRYPEGRVDHRSWEPTPRWVETTAGRILELPLSIRAGGCLAAPLQRLPELGRRMGRKAFGRRAEHQWLRPSWNGAAELVGYAKASDEPVLVCMFHNIELVAGASPYADDDAGVRRILAALEGFLAHCRARGDEFVGLTAAAERWAAR